jgi:hypothetical protein
MMSPAVNAGRLLLEGIKVWLNLARLYCQHQEHQEPAERPMDFVIAQLKECLNKGLVRG